MYRLILTASAALALGACGKNNQADNANVSGDNLTAESIVSNDVTAIDAVTGDAANMAADVDMNEGDLGNEVSDEASAPKPAVHAPKTSRTQSNSADNSAAPANSVSNAE